MPKRPVEPRAGSLLVASPHLADPNFRSTVVLLCDHGPKGSLGFVLNRPAGKSLEDILPVPNQFPDRVDPVFLGGPVGLDSMTILHREKDLSNAKEILPGVYLGGAVDELSRIVVVQKTPPASLRFLLGYAGWGEGQLEGEIEENIWVLCPGSPEWVFDGDPETLWTRVLRSVGSLLAHFPSDPRVN